MGRDIGDMDSEEDMEVFGSIFPFLEELELKLEQVGCVQLH